MTQLTHAQYEVLERAVIDGTRIAIERRGRRKYVLIPLRLGVAGGREVIEARNPTTGHAMMIFLDEIDGIEVVR